MLVIELLLAVANPVIRHVAVTFFFGVAQTKGVNILRAQPIKCQPQATHKIWRSEH